MKKLGTLKLKDVSILSDSEMKNVLGGNRAVSCTISLNCAYGSISCTSTIGDCEYIYGNISGVNIVTAIRCEDEKFTCSSGSTQSTFSF